MIFYYRYLMDYLKRCWKKVDGLSNTSERLEVENLKHPFTQVICGIAMVVRIVYLR